GRTAYCHHRPPSCCSHCCSRCRRWCCVDAERAAAVAAWAAAERRTRPATHAAEAAHTWRS
ncbi:hypothetical protein OFB80_33860, partial [Escherichia coli]|nr:hypothetical protein [Escherichia coli]